MLQMLAKVSCGNITGIPSKIPNLSSDIFTLIEIAVPILLVIMGSIDMFKGIVADKEDEIIKGRKLFVKRLIIGALVFFIFTIVKALVGFLDNNTNSNNIVSCMNCFIRNNCSADVTGTKTEEKQEEPEPQVAPMPNIVITDDTPQEEPIIQQQDKLNKETGSFTKNYSGVNYYLYVPNGATKKMPLVIFLHGVGEKGSISKVKNLKPVTTVTDGTLSGLENFIFLAPASPSNLHWGESGTWNNLIKLIDYITNEYSIDTSRIYLTGFSAGGMGVWSLVNKYPTKFRAAVAVSGNIASYNVNNLKKISIYAIVGANESNFVGPMQTMVNEINKAGGNVKFKKIPNANHIVTQNSYSTRELYEWLLSQ